jgi:Ca-activated chloride channel family protein
MTFIWSPMLLLLVLVPALVALYVRAQQRRRQIIANYSNSMLLSGQSGQRVRTLRHIPPLMFLVALTILIIALARPEAVIGVPRIEGTVILAFDISGSMAADDLDPTRLEAAKTAAQAFVERQPPTVRIGVVAFSDTGLAVQQATYDQAEVLATIHRLSPSLGTSLGNGILVSLAEIETPVEETNFYSNLTPEPTSTPTPVPEGTYQAGVIVLLTDGENTEDPDPIEIAQTAADRGVRIYPIGIGSAAGTVLNIEGFNVFTQLDEALLQAIAEMTGGSYFNAESGEELLGIYENLDRQLVISPEPMEITPLFAGLSILLLLIGGALSMLWFGRVP